MKNICLSILLGFSTISLLAQTALIQTGVVREQNSGKRPVEGVQIIFTSAVPTTSEQTGKFRLAFAGKKAGDLAFMTEIAKKGYELVNDKELEHVKLSSTEQFGTDIIVAKAGVIDSAKKDYYAISDKALKVGFEKRKALLKSELAKAQLSAKQYQDQYEALQKQYENQRKELDNLSEKFAKVNFDDVSPLYQEALQLFKDGKIDEAIKKLEGADLNKQTQKIIKERKDLEEDKKALADRDSILAKKEKEQIETIQLLAQMYVTNLDIAKAETQYDQLLILDSTNLDILTNVADFYKENHRYEKALRLYPKIIAHPQVEDWQIATAYLDSGDMLTNIGQLEKAMSAFSQHKNIHEGLLIKNPNVSFYKKELSLAYSRLGNTHKYLGNLDKALAFYEGDRKLSKELYVAYPNDVSSKDYLVDSYEKLGNTHTALGNLDKALWFYEEYNRIKEELCVAYPNNVDFKNGLAISYLKLGETHTSLGNLDKVLRFYEEYNRLEKELYTTYSNNVKFKNGLGISYEKLGDTHTSLGNLDKALFFYEEEVKLFKELYVVNPNNVEFKNGLGVSYERLGKTHESLGNLDKALGFYEERNRLGKELYVTNPNNVEFKAGLAISYEKLGTTYILLDSLDKALFFYEESVKLFKELFVANPNNVEFKNGLGWSYGKIGITYRLLGNLDKPLFFYEEAIKLFKELYVANPNNVEFKNGLAISYYNLGAFSRNKLKDKTKARAYFKQAEALYKELVHDSPQYVQFKKFLSILQSEMKDLDTPSVFDLDTTGESAKQLAIYQKAVEVAKTDADKAPPQYQLVLLYEKLLKTYEGNQKDTTDLSNAYGSLAWYQLFAQEFSAAEQSAKRGLSLDGSQDWINTNLAPALLYQGKWEAAKSLYLTLKDKPYGKATYKETFLGDLDELEKAGVTHKDVTRIRTLLKQ